MTYVWAGLLAAAGAWVLNRFVLRHFGDAAVIWLIPWLEETIKTGTALYSGADLLLTHSIFGLVEASHDYFASPRGGLSAGLAGLVSHWFYGWVTGVFFRLTSSWYMSIFFTGSLHVLWNYFIIWFFSTFTGSRQK